MKKMVALAILAGMLSAAPMAMASDASTAGDPGNAATMPKTHKHKQHKKAAPKAKTADNAAAQEK